MDKVKVIRQLMVRCSSVTADCSVLDKSTSLVLLPPLALSLQLGINKSTLPSTVDYLQISV